VRRRRGPTAPAPPGDNMSFSEARKDLLVGIFFALLSLLFIFVLNRFGIDIPTANYQVGSAAVLPDFFPNMICWFTFICSLGLAYTSLKGMRASQQVPGTSEKPAEDESEEKTAKGRTLAFRIAGMGTMILLYYVVDFLGIVVAGFLSYLLYAGLTGERRPLRALSGATVTTLILYYFFVKVAAVPMPLGLLSDIFSM
jgi:hypothetical protein